MDFFEEVSELAS